MMFCDHWHNIPLVLGTVRSKKTVRYIKFSTGQDLIGWLCHCCKLENEVSSDI